MTISMFNSDSTSFPYLKGKAAELRHFGPALLYAVCHFMAPGNKQHQEVKLMLEMLNKMESILDNNADAYRLPTVDAADFEKCCWSVMQLNTALANHYHPQEILLFNHTVKFHYILHIGMIARYINPRIGWCYTGEDFMQKIKQVVQSCHAGAGPHLVVSKVVYKYAHGMSLDLTSDIWKQ
jgi:hypothetical protein